MWLYCRCVTLSQAIALRLVTKLVFNIFFVNFWLTEGVWFDQRTLLGLLACGQKGLTSLFLCVDLNGFKERTCPGPRTHSQSLGHVPFMLSAINRLIWPRIRNQRFIGTYKSFFKEFGQQGNSFQRQTLRRNYSAAFQNNHLKVCNVFKRVSL